MNQYNATYKGYKKGLFIFHINKGSQITLYPFEVCPLLPESRIINIMNNEIGHKFIIGVYSASTGYYVRNRWQEGKLVYDLYDAVLKLFAGITFENKDDIPKEIKGKKIHFHGKKILLSKVTTK